MKNKNFLIVIKPESTSDFVSAYLVNSVCHSSTSDIGSIIRREAKEAVSPSDLCYRLMSIKLREVEGYTQPVSMFTLASKLADYEQIIEISWSMHSKDPSRANIKQLDKLKLCRAG